VARSKHTRPQEIIAARRVRLPSESRGSGDLSASKRIGRILKELGITDDLAPESKLPEARMPRITVQKPREGYCHPITKRDIKQLLLFFGERSYYGVREIRLSQLPAHATAAGKLFGRLYIPGKIVLYEQAIPPWYLSGNLDGEELKALTRAGATVERSDDGMRCVIRWSGEALQNFFLFDVLMHEIGHHLQQQFKAKRTVQVLRTRDHENSARLFANKCRIAFLESKEIDASG
jgi:hypothetical protein